MEQRPLRLGDIVDDYCPRERRVTNHAIVAIIGDAIRQTRCTTCDTEHVYKHAKEPRRRKSATPAGLYERVLADAGGQLVPPRPPEPDEPAPEVVSRDEPPMAAAPAAAAAPATDEREVEPDADDRDRDHDVWPGHRQLIRATLPRTEGEPPPPRPIPEFTMHQRQRPRGGHGFRHANGWSGRGHGHQGNGNVNGNVDGNTRGGHPGSRQRRSGRHRGKPKPPR
jgi:hypothetical protein